MSAVVGVGSRGSWTRWVDRLSVGFAVVGGIATVVLMVNVVVDVVGRVVFNHPLRGTLELTQFVWMPALVSLGLGYALLAGEHIRVNLLTAPTGPGTRRVVEIVSMAFSFVVVGLLLWFGVDKVVSSMAINEQAMGLPWLPVWPSRWVVVIGLAGLLLQTLAMIWSAITVDEFDSADENEELAAIEAEASVFDQLEDVAEKAKH